MKDVAGFSAQDL